MSIGSAVVLQLTVDSDYILKWDGTFPQNCPFSWEIWAPSNAWFLGSTQAHVDWFIRFRAARGCVQLTDRQRDRQTGHTTSIARGRVFALRACDAA